MNDELLVKYIGIPLLLLMALIGAILPRFFMSHVVASDHQSYFLAIANSCAAGVFFAAGMLHMLAEAIDSLSEHQISAGSGDYPVALFLCCIGFLITLFFERVLVRGGHEAIIAALDMHKNDDDNHDNNIDTTINDNKQYKRKESNNDALIIDVDPCCDNSTNGYNDNNHHNDDHNHNHYQSNSHNVTSSFLQHNNNDYQSISDEFQNQRRRHNTTTSHLPKAIRSYLKNNQSPRPSGNIHKRSAKVRLKYYSKLFDAGLKAGLMVANEIHSHESTSMGEVHIHSSTKEEESTNPVPYIVMCVLSLHAFITGIALGTTQDFQNAAMLLAVLLLHKFSAAASLSIIFLKCELVADMAFKLLFLFSFTTPCGLGVGLILNQFDSDSSLISGIFMAISSGTFLYIALMSIVVEEFIESTSHLYKKFIALLFGFALMSAVALVA